MPRDSILRPLIPIAVGWIVGIVLGDRYPGCSIWALALQALLLLSIFRSIRRRRHVVVVPLLFLLCTGYLAIQPWRDVRYPAHHVIHFADRMQRQIFGTIEEIGETRNFRTRSVVRVDRLMHKGKPIDAAGKIRLTLIGKRPHVSPGDHVSFVAKIKKLHNYNNPGGFDYRRYMAFRNIHATAYTASDRIRMENPSPRRGTAHVLPYIRSSLGTAIDGHARGSSAAILRALTLGRRDGIPADLRDIFHQTGTGHLLAISGLHLGVIASGAFLLFSWLFSFSRPLLQRGWKSRAAAVAAIFPVLGYGVVAGLSPSTQRAMVMVSVFLLTFLVGRERDGFNSLAAAAVVLILFHPPCVFSVSFQLSFAAVASILLVVSICRRSPSPEPGGWTVRAGRKAVMFFTITMAATAGTLPVVMFYFNRLSAVGPLANALAVPVIGGAVVPIALVSCIILPFSDALAGIGFQVAAVLIDRVIDALRWMGALPWASFRTFTPSLLEIFLFYALFACLISLLRKPDFAGRPVGRPAPRFFALRMLTVLLMLAGAADAAYWVYERHFRNDLRVTVLDVGQGSAALVELPGGKQLLVDGGGFSDNRIFDVGEKIVAPLLWRKKIGSLDALVLSHANSDHLNGLLFVANQFRVKEVWHNGEAGDTSAYREFMQIVDRKNIALREIEKPPVEDAAHGVEIEFLNPPIDFLKKKRAENWRCLNNNSLAIKITYGRHAFLFPGDIKQRAELEMVARHQKRLCSTVLVSPHHGSRYSSTDDFLRLVQPSMAVISCGWNNRFGFPHREVLDRYRKHGLEVFRTDTAGAVEFVTDGRRMSVRTMLGGRVPEVVS